MFAINSVSLNATYKPQILNRKNVHQNTVSFKARPLSILGEEYSRLSKTLSPVKAFLGISEDMASMDALLTTILGNNVQGQAFIKDIVANQRHSEKITSQLSDKIGGGSKNLLTFLPDSPYRIAYGQFISERFKNASSVSELLAIRPDWKGEKLLEKHRNLFGNEDFELGNLPAGLDKEKTFAIVDYLRGFMQGSAKSPQNIGSRNFGGTNFEFEYFTDGRTDKNVFGVLLPDDRKYIIKMADKDKRSLDNPFALGTLAKIDTFLTANKSKNSAPLLYYNHDRNFLIYEYIEHLSVNGNSRDLAEVKAHIPDYKALGLDFNDSVGTNNCFELTEKSNLRLKDSAGFEEGVKNGEWVSVDNDHVTFSSRLQPQIYEFHSYLPNAMQFCV